MIVPLALVAVGAAVVAPALWRAGIRGWALFGYTAGLAPALGFGPLSLLTFYGRLWELGRPGAWTVAVAAGVLLVLARWATPPAAARAASRAPRALAIAAIVVLVGSGIGALVVHHVERRAWPEGTFDAVAIWNVRARFFHRDARAFPSSLSAVERSSHPHYPLLLPLTVAGQYGLAGREAPGIAQGTALAFALGTGLLLLGVLADAGHWPLGALAAALFWTTPLALVWGFSQGADGAVGYFLLVALAALAAALDDRLRLPGWVAGAGLGLLAWTKNEGLVLAGLAAACGALCRLRQRGRGAWREPAAGVVGALPGVAAVLIMKARWAPESGAATFLQNDWTARVLDWQRWAYPATELGARLVGARVVEGWSAAWPVLLAGAALATLWPGRPRGRSAPLWLGALSLSALSFVAFYAVTPYEQRWHVTSSIDRLLLQLYPAAIAGVFLAIASLRSPGIRTASSAAGSRTRTAAGAWPPRRPPGRSGPSPG